MNILVTGGAGFVGSFICESHLKRGDSVIALDLSDGAKIDHLMDNPEFRFLQGSITDELLMDREIRACDVIYHLAAIADPRVYVEDPLRTMEMDLVAGLKVVEAASRYAKKLIFTSTSEVYGRNPKVPWQEDDDRVLGSTTVNRWCYATSKAAVEHLILAHRQRNSLEFVIFRLFNIYGPRLDTLGAGRVIPIFLHRFLNGLPVQVHGDGKQTRTFCYVEDAVEGMVQSAMSPAAANTILNVGTDLEISVLEIAHTLKRLGGFESEIEFVSHESVFGTSYEDIPRRVPDLSRIEDLVGWKATTALDDGLVKTIEYYREQASRSMYE